MGIETILDGLDSWLFYFFNKTLANPLFDSFMPFITESKHWFIFYFIVGLYLLIKGGPRGRVLVVIAIVMILCSDQLSNVLKELFGRVRPCHSLPNVNLLVGCSSAYSFPSNHAVNNFAAAYLFTHFYPKMKWWFYTGAIVISLSRVFVGVHYPFDILGGAAIGTLIAMILIFIWKKINEKFKILKA
jgi:undecaprenyl-diphosphatase